VAIEFVEANIAHWQREGWTKTGVEGTILFPLTP
jgi:hypothetical protein